MSKLRDKQLEFRNVNEIINVNIRKKRNASNTTEGKNASKA